MRKKLFAGTTIGIIIAVALMGYIVLMNKKPSDTPASPTTTNSGAKTVASRACDLFTQDEAKQILGDTTTASSQTDPVNGKGISIDTCSYSNNASTVAAIRIATIMVRSTTTDEGIESNKEAFEIGGTAHPEGATAVAGYGEKAFWDPATNQLAILKGNTWIAILYGGTNPKNNTLDDAKKIADLVVE